MIFAFILTYVAASGSRLVGSSVGATAVHPGSFTEQAATTYQPRGTYRYIPPRAIPTKFFDGKKSSVLNPVVAK